MIKPITAEPVPRLKPLPERPAIHAGPGVLGEATHRVLPDPFEVVLRDALISLREALSRLDSEADPVARHLGIRGLKRDVAASELDVEQLSRIDEQVYARELISDLVGREARSLDKLDGAARADLEVLLRLEQLIHEKLDVAARGVHAARDQALERATAERIQRDIERQTRMVEGLPTTPRPWWLRLTGVTLAITGFAVFVVSRTTPGRWIGVLAAVSLAATGFWLSLDPSRRRERLLAGLQRLVDLRQLVTDRDARAGEVLALARTRFEEIDLACERQEALALAVFERRPGIRPYVGEVAPSVSLAPSRG